MTEQLAPVVPTSYAEWKHCINVLCRIPLTTEFVQARIAALHDPRDHGTQRFIQIWGQAQLDLVRGWFAQARAELAAPPR